MPNALWYEWMITGGLNPTRPFTFQSGRFDFPSNTARPVTTLFLLSQQRTSPIQFPAVLQLHTYIIDNPLFPFSDQTSQLPLSHSSSSEFQIRGKVSIPASYSVQHLIPDHNNSPYFRSCVPIFLHCVVVVVLISMFNFFPFCVLPFLDFSDGNCFCEDYESEILGIYEDSSSNFDLNGSGLLYKLKTLLLPFVSPLSVNFRSFFEGYGYHGTSFEQTYRCYPASFIEKPHIESGDKIIMPPSALDRLASLHIDYPMLFELRNDSAERVSHCGVLEFIAEEGMIYMPYWMMENMLLQEGDIVRVKNVTLPKGTYVKLQPHTKDFLDISNPKAILETTLRNFSCLTTGDSIMVAYNNKKYYIDIIETKPANAISIIETDCEVDFAPPLDYKEPEKPTAPLSANKGSDKVEEIPAENEPKFNPFTGTGRRLDGKPLKNPPPPASSSGSKDKRADAQNGSSHSSAASGSQSNAAQSQKLVFGSNASRNKETGKEKESKQEPPQQKEEPKFQPFTGKKYSLRG
ncbi:ubiquitin fusion degradation protein 1-like protein [Senna tora]|uniref:Ubiquitin fusion degradation protein 1-like protein n=1 Tax=Senna tora TaxID=362788 RepID=A0A834SSP6_9FABA|nr:ubiquitin fusion degradation protein 1-like protein [Senna tora]